MRTRLLTLLAAGLIFAATGLAKNKKPVLPAYVLTARTVAVIIDPTAGISVEDPRENEIARADVEAALRTWGRFEIINTQPADLLIVVRRGHGRVAQPTIHDPRQAGGPIDGDGGISADNSRPPTLSGSNPNPSAGNDRPYPQTEIGGIDDTFIVYRGDVDKPLNASPAWRYTASDALQPHSVPAVGKFRQAVADAEKAANKGP